MCLNRESFSNEIDESDRQFKRHDEQKLSALRGIVIDLRAEPWNVSDSIHFSRESFSNEMMKVIGNAKNTMNKGFQY
jgi:hypothetical protein